MGIALSAVGEGLREATRDGGGASFRRVCMPLPPAGDRHTRHRFITASKNLSPAVSFDLVQQQFEWLRLHPKIRAEGAIEDADREHSYGDSRS